MATFPESGTLSCNLAHRYSCEEQCFSQEHIYPALEFVTLEKEPAPEEPGSPVKSAPASPAQSPAKSEPKSPVGSPSKSVDGEWS